MKTVRLLHFIFQFQETFIFLLTNIGANEVISGRKLKDLHFLTEKIVSLPPKPGVLASVLSALCHGRGDKGDQPAEK